MGKSASISNRLPVQIDPHRLAVARQILTGELPLKSCKRLNQLVFTDADDGTANIKVDIEFGIDSEQVHYCTGSITADLQLICQRCMEPMVWQAQCRVNLAFVKSDYEAESLPSLYEPYILHSVPLAMSDIIEDELLLALPQISLHNETKCPASQILKSLATGSDASLDTSSDTDPDVSHANENPFAALGVLKTPRQNENE